MVSRDHEKKLKAAVYRYFGEGALRIFNRSIGFRLTTQKFVDFGRELAEIFANLDSLLSFIFFLVLV